MHLADTEGQMTHLHEHTCPMYTLAATSPEDLATHTPLLIEALGFFGFLCKAATKRRAELPQGN